MQPPTSQVTGGTRLVMEPRTFAGFLLAFAAVLVIATLSYDSMRTQRRGAELVAQTVEALATIQAVLSTIKDAETGQRGYLITGREYYLEPYTAAMESLPKDYARARSLLANDPAQLERLGTLESVAKERLQIAAQTIELRRAGQSDAAVALVLTDRGKHLMDRIRDVAAEMGNVEQQKVTERTREWRESTTVTFTIIIGGAGLLLVLTAGAALLVSRDFRARQREAWLRSGQIGLSGMMQGDLPLERLADNVLKYLAQLLEARVGALFIAEGGLFRRVAGYAIPASADVAVVRPGDGLAGQAAKDNRPMRVTAVPADYLPVGSATGRGTGSELLIAPAGIDGRVYAVIELGFFGAPAPGAEELLSRVSEPVAAAIRASRDRSRLEELLQETQQQAEELQTREEELRVNNEELEEQGRTLRESRTQLESQQAELEQINSQLEEQTQVLEDQKDSLAKSHAVLAARSAELKRANEYKSEFLANMSHELRTPLNSILILAKLLSDNKQGNLDENQQRFAHTISSAGRDLLALINDVLDLSRIEAGKIEIAPEPVSIGSLLEGLSKLFQPAAAEKNLKYGAVVEPGTPETLSTDPQRLSQILRNLLSNALKFTQHGEVGLRVFASGSGSISFAVRDTGVGIAPNQHDVIFEAFRQADGSIHRKFGGTGLGLSISRDLARLLGGSIGIQSAPGAGSTFTLTVPLRFAAPVIADPAEPAAAAAARRVPETEDIRRPAAPAAGPRALAAGSVADDRERLSPDRRLILVIEDDAAFAQILRDLCHEMEFQAVVVDAAGDGLIAAAQFQPSAILLDMNLPDFSGLGVLDQLKRNPRTRHVPVHVVSVADYRREALELGAVGYALKPAQREELMEALRRLEARLSQSIRRVLIVEDDARQRESIRELLGAPEVEITAAASAGEALEALASTTFDCVVLDLNLPDLSGYDLLEKMARQEEVSFPPVIVYTGRSLSREEEQRLGRYSKSIIIKDARSPERLLDEVTLFLHQVESKLPQPQQQMLKAARNRDATLEKRRILIVEDDVRNIFALTSLFEPNGAAVEIARNGLEALAALERSKESPVGAIDMVLMDIMMPEMDGFTAMREIRKRPEWKKLPIIALTAKAMRDDQEKCLAAGANDYIAKPLDVEKLLSLVRVWMPK
jgi:CheY-like chemotaxis protein/signal transduction histidine kinase/CHASE3 domain sensor protein